MEAPDRPVEIIIQPGAPPDAGVVFTSIDEEGRRDPIFQYVLRHTGWEPKLSLAELARKGFASQRMPDGRLLIAIATMATERTKAAEALTSGLQNALREMKETLANETIWMPLMGTGAGSLSLEESAIAILEAFGQISASGRLPPPKRITIAPPKEIAQEPLNSIAMRFRKAAFDANISVRPAIQNNIEAFEASAELEESTDPSSSNFDRTPFQNDRAAQIDSLNRRAVAGTMATLIDEIWPSEEEAKADEPHEDSSFMIHLHGRWGSGKTSILNFLKEELESGKVAPRTPPCDPPWLIVDYNAWRNQKLGPAWWTLMNAVYKAALDKLPFRSRAHKSVRLSHFFWKLKIGWLPKAGTAVLTVIALLVASQFELKNDLLDVLKYVAAFMPLFATIFLSGFLNSRVATQYLELAQDPLGPLTARYENMIAEIDRPVVVMIDDVDRCDAAFVVDLLQTIQTLFRGARVLYIVAGDRDWICSSYQKVYSDFADTVSEPGRSLGHLFLEKVFQLSVEVPPLLPHQRTVFWNSLIGEGGDATVENDAEIEAEIEDEVANLDTETALQAYMETKRSDPRQAAIAGAKVFQRMQSPELKREREHFLYRYAELLEPNPRAMKRLLNAYGFRRGYDIQAPEPSDPDALARWTILANRWPILTDHLSGAPAGSGEPPEVRTLLDDPEVRRVAGDYDPKDLWPVPTAEGAGNFAA